MAGLLDSDWVKFLAAPRTYYADKRADASRQEFQGLLGTLEQQGPTQPGEGILGNRSPDPAFWLKAAAIPGYGGLAGQQLGIETQGQQAMGRQTQAQDWSVNNMTLAQEQAQELQRQVAARNYAIAQQDLARKWYGTEASAGASNASAANSIASRDLTLLKQTEQQNKNANLGGPLYNQLPAPDRAKANEELLNADTYAKSAGDVADWATNRGSGAALPAVGTSEANSMKLEWQTSVKPTLMKILNTGVLQPHEEETLASIMGQPDDIMLTKSQLNVIQTMAQKVEDYRDNAYAKFGLKAQPTQRGRSAAARTLSKSQPSGKVTPVTTFGDDQTGLLLPVQRGR